MAENLRWRIVFLTRPAGGDSSAVPMPGMGGEKLAAQLLGFLPEMKVLYMSGYPYDGIVRSGILETGVTLLEKPFTREILTRHVGQVLDAQ